MFTDNKNIISYESQFCCDIMDSPDDKNYSIVILKVQETGQNHSFGDRLINQLNEQKYIPLCLVNINAHFDIKEVFFIEDELNLVFKLDKTLLIYNGLCKFFLNEPWKMYAYLSPEKCYTIYIDRE